MLHENREDWDLIGPVKSFCIETAEMVEDDGQSVERPRTLRCSWHFNEDGRSAESIEYSEEGTVREHEIFVYDSAGYLARRDFLNANGELVDQVTYEYDSLGHRTKIWGRALNGTVVLYTEYEYDDNGKQRSKTKRYYSKQGLLDTFDITIYDDKGTPTEHQIHGADGRLQVRTILNHDALGRRIDSRSYGSNGNFLQREEQTFDNAGNEIAHTCYDEEGNIELQHLRCYDEHRDTTQYTIIKYDGSTTTGPHRMNAYEYDHFGNWTCQRTSRKVDAGHYELERVVYRTFTYYPDLERQS